MTVQQWTFLFVACTFGLYLFVAWRARVRDTGGFYVAGRGVPAAILEDDARREEEACRWRLEYLPHVLHGC